MTTQIHVGNVPIGGGAPVTVQSMTTTDTRDIVATKAQISRLAEAGCEIIRIAVFDMESAGAVRELVDYSSVPLVADVHYNHKLAIAAVENGIQKLRINPGNIGGDSAVRELADCVKAHKIPIRVGVNGGSLEKWILERDGKPTPWGMVDSAISHIRLLEKCGFYDIAVSLKASSVKDMIESYRLFSRISDYPLHLGVTEAGTRGIGNVKSAIGIGALLADGIGDTIRVSLTGDPVPEVAAGFEILEALGLRNKGLSIVSCPTCGRTRIDIESIIEEVKRLVGDIDKPVKAAVMGCVVNGPGEAREVDCGIACGADGGALFVKGVVVGKVETADMARTLAAEIRKLAGEE